MTVIPQQPGGAGRLAQRGVSLRGLRPVTGILVLGGAEGPGDGDHRPTPVGDEGAGPARAPGQYGGHLDAPGGLVAPQLLPNGRVEGVEMVVVARGVDHVTADDGRGLDPTRGLEVPHPGAVLQRQGVETVPRADVQAPTIGGRGSE